MYVYLEANADCLTCFATMCSVKAVIIGRVDRSKQSSVDQATWARGSRRLTIASRDTEHMLMKVPSMVCGREN